MFSVKFITPNCKEFEQVISIRKEVFCNELSVSENEEFDAMDKIGSPSTFAILYENDIPAGTGRLSLTESGYKVGRIAFLKKFRGLGYGEVLVKTLLLKAFDMGAESVHLDARTKAVPFYEKIGFKPNGSEFIQRGMMNMPMIITEKDMQKCGC